MLKNLLELQRLKNLERTGWQLRGVFRGAESVAAHSFGVSIAAMFLADELAARGTAVDVERVLRMSLLHDWAEARVGDLPKTATEYFKAETRKRAEMAAFTDLIQGLGPGANLYRDLYDEYEQRETLEARVVKAADIIDLLVQVLALERAGARGLDEFWGVVDQADFGLEGTAKQTVERVLQELLSARSSI